MSRSGHLHERHAGRASHSAARQHAERRHHRNDTGNVFIKMTGPVALVKSATEKFRALIESAAK